MKSKMKKVFIGIALLATVAVFSSCKKECTCTTYMGGIKMPSITIEDDQFEGKCSDMSEEEVLGIEVKCK